MVNTNLSAGAVLPPGNDFVISQFSLEGLMYLLFLSMGFSIRNTFYLFFLSFRIGKRCASFA